MINAHFVCAGWNLQLVDYFDLPFSAPTAFSLTDASAIRSWPQVMMVEEAVSLIVAILVMARLVNPEVVGATAHLKVEIPGRALLSMFVMDSPRHSAPRARPNSIDGTDTGPRHASGRLMRRAFALGGTSAALAVILACSLGASAFATTTSDTKPLPAGRYPSKVSKEVCKSDAPEDVGQALHEKPKVTAPTWVNHLYSCSYQYPNASMTLSVKELSSPQQTTAYFNSLGVQMGVVRKLKFLGQGAFQTTDGSVVVRKDYKVLLVNDAGLPAKFGMPPTTPGDIAVTVADVVLGCWAGD